MNSEFKIHNSKLIVITGPTAVGKTAEAIRVARELGSEVVSCDSRQFYRELRIGVARPSEEELAAVPHHFIACRSVSDPYNISTYEQDALALIAELHRRMETVVVVGGSGLYIDALLHGVSRMPDPTPELRERLQAMPLEEKRRMLGRVDPEYYARVDLRNPVRLQRALEVYHMTGRPYSAVVAEGRQAARPFETEVRVMQLPTSDLRQRIDRRVDAMMAEGLMEEVRSVQAFRHLNTLNTVGYKELFEVIDGRATMDEAVQAIKFNTWHYARKQMTWMRRYL